MNRKAHILSASVILAIIIVGLLAYTYPIQSLVVFIIAFIIGVLVWIYHFIYTAQIRKEETERAIEIEDEYWHMMSEISKEKFKENKNETHH